jgi:hypothetical protein
MSFVPNSPGAAPSRFANGLSGISPTFQLLFGTHICDLYSARSALEEKRLRPTSCPKFNGEDLLYLFYGKPSFRPETAMEGKRFTYCYPVCFVVNLEKTITWKRVFPFDTGAFPDRYADFMHPDMQLRDFLMPPDCESPRRIVEAFFASNGDYFDVKPLTKSKVPATIETTAYHSLISAFGAGQSFLTEAKKQSDDRLVSIEMQATGELALDSGRIVRIILPDKALELDDIQTGLAACGIEFEPYRTGSLSTNECHAFINARLRELNKLP